ncbi:hypothetical protein EPUS_01595 [Endocarpon pusillum Z07020]|uniref:AN1-type domain-containing protein n=1 Tax=Endocarpon pusillum (strain Z07020 / HMAS-L-300199) TaxID=1263415 RepID=U1HY46_ENDPU|nr:uncharacterized protein EPUS_01595 [Endocarpon pusillum Z07020]ERF75765.1 hypothetical protein EPUS_01595 [Endocarpon pusillum Z07020]
MRSRSSSASSASSLPADNVQIFVKIGGGKTIPLNVRPSNSISDVLAFLSASTTLPSDVRLLLAGRHLPPSETVSSLNLQPATTLELLSPLRGGTAPPEMGEASTLDTKPAVSAGPDTPSSGAATPTTTAGTTTSGTSTPTTTTAVRRKPRCAHPPCKAAAQAITGDCGFCQKRFCSKHRMLESHACEGLEDAKKAERDRNREKLENERTVMVRGI